jgi:hypothetical protein
MARYRNAGTNWRRFTATVVNNTTGFYNSGIFTDSLGIFAGTDASNNPLPVQLLSLSAKAQHGDVMVNWSTASEINSLGFDVERSSDGRSFESVGFVKGAGNSSKTVNYLYNDAAAFAKAANNTLYYRLKQTDLNGAFSYSGVVSVSIHNMEMNGMSAYPNPFNNNVQLSFHATQEGIASIRIMDIRGMLVAQQNNNISSGMNHVAVEQLSSLPNGMYFVELSVNGERTVVKMMKGE